MKPKFQACITLDLEPDHAGYAPESYDAWEIDRVRELLSLFKKHKVGLTIFVVAKTLKKKNKIIKLFSDYGSEFHLHSYSHKIKEADSSEEIINGKKEFETFFRKSPIGYRAPGGLITQKGLVLLKKEGFYFDASVFPSFWPRPHYLLYPNRPFKPLADGLIEIPFSTISPLRFIVSLSWMKLFGWKFYRFLFEHFSLPDVLVFGLHLHDLWSFPAQAKLPLFWKLVYIRNKNNGLKILDQFLSDIKKRDYNFSTMEAVVKDIKSAN